MREHQYSVQDLLKVTSIAALLFGAVRLVIYWGRITNEAEQQAIVLMLVAGTLIGVGIGRGYGHRALGGLLGLLVITVIGLLIMSAHLSANCGATAAILVGQIFGSPN